MLLRYFSVTGRFSGCWKTKETIKYIVDLKQSQILQIFLNPAFEGGENRFHSDTEVILPETGTAL